MYDRSGPDSNQPSGAGCVLRYSGGLLQQLEQSLLDTVSRHIAIRYGLTDIPVTVEQPRQSSFGELALPVAFQLAKPLRQAPKKIAQELADEIGAIEGISQLEVAGNGYINVRFDRGLYGAALLRAIDSRQG